MTARLYSNARAIPLALYSKEVYQDVAHRWQGMGFGYLFLLLSLLCVPVTLVAVVWSLTITLDSPYDFNYLIDQIPEIQIENGEAKLSVPQPYYIKTKDTAEIVGVIDTTRPVNEWPKELPESRLLFVLGKNELMTYDAKKSEKRIYDLPKGESFPLNRDVVRELAQNILGFVWIFPLFIVPLMVPFLFLYVAAVMFVYGLVGLLFNLFLRTGYSYGDCVRLACVSSTAGLIIGLLAMIPGIHLSGWVDFSIDMLYLFFAMWAAKQE